MPSNPGDPRRALMAQAVDDYQRGVDGVHMQAIVIARILKLEPDDVPRLLVSAACRSVEKLIEQYRQVRDNGHSSPVVDRLRREVAGAATDLVAVLGEGHRVAQTILTSLDDPPDGKVQ